MWMIYVCSLVFTTLVISVYAQKMMISALNRTSIDSQNFDRRFIYIPANVSYDDGWIPIPLSAIRYMNMTSRSQFKLVKQKEANVSSGRKSHTSCRTNRGFLVMIILMTIIVTVQVLYFLRHKVIQVFMQR